MSSAVRELEKVVDAQKDYIRDVRFSQRLRSSSTSKRPEIQGHILSSNGNDGPTVVVVAEKASGKLKSVLWDLGTFLGFSLNLSARPDS